MNRPQHFGPRSGRHDCAAGTHVTSELVHGADVSCRYDVGMPSFVMAIVACVLLCFSGALTKPNQLAMLGNGLDNMNGEFLHPAEKQRLWLWERLLPAMLLLVVPLGVFFFLRATASDARQREQLVNRVNRISDNYSVEIDSVKIQDHSTVVSALRGIADVPAHHSNPGEPHLVRITSGRNVVEVCLARDSDRPSEYWVATPTEGKCDRRSLGSSSFGRLTNVRLDSLLN